MKNLIRSVFSYRSDQSLSGPTEVRAAVAGRSLSRRLTVLAGLALWLSFGWLGLADHGGPIIYVDCTRPGDGQFHFTNIKDAVAAAKEFGTIVVLPCTYNEGDLKIATNSKNEILKGLSLKSQAGRDKTKIKGNITLSAKSVVFCGFDIDAGGAENAVVVAEDGVLVCENKIHNAKGDGLFVTKGADNVTAQKNEIFNNGGWGVKVDAESDDFRAVGNLIRSNGAGGLLISTGSDRCLITQNDIALNTGDGVMIQEADECQISENREIENNKGHGIVTLKANGTKILKNPNMASNKRYGVSLQSSDNSEVRDNELFKNDAGGIELKGGDDGPAKKNTVTGNKIINHGIAGAQGILLAGDVEANTFLGNTLTSNSIGICLTFFDKEKGGCLDSGQGRMPGNNTFASNVITDNHQQGIVVIASRGRNVFQSNTLTGNNEAGIEVEEMATNDTFANNKIQDNGKQGILLMKAKRHIIKDNPIVSNGEAGVELDGANDNTVDGNTIKENERDGIAITNGATNNDITNNAVEANHFNGLKLDGAKDTDVRRNKFVKNYYAGVLVQSGSEKVFMDHNEIIANYKGGVEIKDSKNLDIEQNNIYTNIQFGVKACQGVEMLQLDRNWWGDASGPSGAFEGKGNAVILCTGAKMVFPWLLAPWQDLVESSTVGLLNDVKLGSTRADFDASDKTDTRLNFYNMDPNASGGFIIAKYLPNRPDSAKNLKNPVKVVSVLVSNFHSGTAQIEVEYRDSELPKGVDAANLCLFMGDHSDKGNWSKLNCFVKKDAHIVLAEVPVEKLTQAPLIALATNGQ